MKAIDRMAILLPFDPVRTVIAQQRNWQGNDRERCVARTAQGPRTRRTRDEPLRHPAR